MNTPFGRRGHAHIVSSGDLHEVGEVLSLAFRFDYPQLKKKCEYYLMNEPESEWFQKLAFADLYDLPLLRQHVLDNTVGLRQICKHLHYHRFLSTETLRSILAKALEMSDLKQFGEEPPSGWQTPCLHKITENRWERLKRVPVVGGIVGEPDVTEAVEKFESTFMPKHFGVELITPHFSFAEKNLFNYNIQLGPDHRLLYKLEWNNVQPANLVWSVDATVLIRMQYLGSQGVPRRRRASSRRPFDKWEGLKVIKLFQFDHRYLDSNLNLNVQGHDFYVRSKTVFKEIPALREYLEQNFEAGTKQYVISDLQGEKSMPAFETMLQVAFRCSFITNY
ncbi:unnamed protein product [Caenorhabditis sp. 36 PRJEB53466]|nr:unnamed protein product [Caenorhabditis sp. 36 PRJEB53466]